MREIRVSIIIVSWNALEIVKRCLPSVTRTDFDGFEIIFADNASTDGSASWVESEFPEIRVVRNPENWGFARGNNEAARHARGEIIVLLNNDVEVPPGWLTPIVAHLDENSNVGAAQPKLHQFDKREHFEYSGAAGGFLDRHGYPFARGRIFDTLEADSGQYDGTYQGTSEIFWASGTCLVIRRSLWERFFGLEESFFMHMEEIDLCWRIRSAGYQIVCVTDSVVYHMGGASLAQGSPQKTYLNFRNNLLMLYRNLPANKWRRVFAARLVLDGTAILRAFLTLKPGDGWAILRAYVAAHRMKSQFANAPHEGSAPLPYTGSIVLDYFLRGRKHFSELPQDKFHRQDSR